MPKPSLSPYQRAVARGRARIDELDPVLAREILRALDNFAEGLQRALLADLGDLSPSGRASTRALRRAEEIARLSGERLMFELIRAIEENRTLSFQSILAIWEEAGRKAAESVGVSGVALGRIRTPAITMAGAFDAAGSAGTWKTLIRGHAQNAASEVNRIVRMGLIEGVEPDELARRMRRYVVGSEPFRDLFEQVPTVTGDVAKLNINKIPRPMRDSARQMEWNARRIGWTETHNARHEADIQHVIRDPFVAAITWTLSPDRGSQIGPDECDSLAEEDFYGLGPGVHPVDKIPGPPHPMDLCSRIPVPRDAALIDRPKPSPALRVDPSRAKIPRSGDVTKKGAERIRKNVANSIAMGTAATRRAA